MSTYDAYDLSENQELFCNDAEDQGFEVDFTYSGRGMYGDKCPAIRVDRMSEFKTDVDFNYDSMGLGYVIYCPF